MRPVRFAVFGTNFISGHFADAVAHTDGAEISAVYSRREETGRVFADACGGAHVYTDMDALFAADTSDACYIATPNMCHRDMTVAALRAGRHVLCEKPMAQSAGDATFMIDEARKAGRVLLEAMRPDFDPAYDVLRAYLPKVGTVRRATLDYCQYSSRYDAFLRGDVKNAFRSDMGNAALADIGIYPLRVAVTLFGMPTDVCARSVFLSNGFEGAGQVLLTYPDKTVTVVYSKISDSENPSVIEGEAGALTVDRITTPTRIVYRPRGGAAETVYTAAPYNNMTCEVAAFLRMVRGEMSPSPYLSLTENTLTLYDAAVRSAGIFGK